MLCTASGAAECPATTHAAWLLDECGEARMALGALQHVPWGPPSPTHALFPRSSLPGLAPPPVPQLFQSTFIKIINPKASIIEVLEWTALNSAVALVGYYFAAFTIDRPWMGRMRMQVRGSGRRGRGAGGTGGGGRGRCFCAGPPRTPALRPGWRTRASCALRVGS